MPSSFKTDSTKWRLDRGSSQMKMCIAPVLKLSRCHRRRCSNYIGPPVLWALYVVQPTFHALFYVHRLVTRYNVLHFRSSTVNQSRSNSDEETPTTGHQLTTYKPGLLVVQNWDRRWVELIKAGPKIRFRLSSTRRLVAVHKSPIALLCFLLIIFNGPSSVRVTSTALAVAVKCGFQ